MILTGLIKDNKETLPGANIYVSDAQGKQLSPLRGDSSDVVTGGYVLEGVTPTDYVTVSFVGYGKVTKKVGDLGSGEVIQHDFVLAPATAELKEFEIVEYVTKPTNNKRNGIIFAGIGLVAIISGIIIYK